MKFYGQRKSFNPSNLCVGLITLEMITRNFPIETFENLRIFGFNYRSIKVCPLALSAIIHYLLLGIRGNVDIDDRKKEDWRIYPLEFKKDFVLR